ncbi:hypothetical protein [Natronococcus occultus]|uniref:Uncharacterized protein n=1 Tax=Natronococcus occultus SP4 TaxID=694430 RepID=L0JWH9_9EURY|nr:hypothetical protein [Natronococcus occultus]AGB37367.1 hypothetical protein Natoc_1560 [Natronococcus occultus SP4]
MERRSRRALLSAVTGAATLLAGCIADELGDESNESDDGTGSNGDDEADDGNESDEAANGNGSDDAVDETAFTTPEPREEPAVALLTDRDGADDWFAVRDVDDDVGTFLEDTAFDDASVIVLEARAPNLCYELGLESVTIEDGVTIKAVVDDDDAAGCAQQEATTGQLVGLSEGGEPVTDGTVTIVDHDAATHEFDLDEDAE